MGPLVYSLALGMSVSDVSGKAIANLATEELKHPAPVFHGDTLFCESEVLEKKESQSKPDRGTVKVHTRVLNQDGVLVAEFKRLVLVPPQDRRGRPSRRASSGGAAPERPSPAPCGIAAGPTARRAVRFPARPLRAFFCFPAPFWPGAARDRRSPSAPIMPREPRSRSDT